MISCVRKNLWRENKFWRFGFTQNGRYHDQPHPLEALIQSFDSSDANSTCCLTKQDLTFKQAHLVRFCFVLWNPTKFWHLTLVPSAFYRLYLEIALFRTKPEAQTEPVLKFSCNVTVNNIAIVVVDCITTLLVFDYPKFQELLFNTLQSRKVGVQSVGTKVDFWQKSTYMQSFLTKWNKHFTSQKAGGEGAFAGRILGGAMIVVFCKRLPQL